MRKGKGWESCSGMKRNGKEKEVVEAMYLLGIMVKVSMLNSNQVLM